MAIIPNFVLKRLYVAGSLRNTPGGCAFEIKNVVDTGTVTRFYELEIDGQAYRPADLEVHTPRGQTVGGGEIRPETPLPLPGGASLTVTLPGVSLSPGKHSLRLHFGTKEAGDLSFKVSDQLQPTEPPTPIIQYPISDPQPPAPDTGSPLANPRIAILGAGSAVFSRQLMADLLCTPGLARGTFALVDIDAERLDLARRMAGALVEHSGRDWEVEASVDRREVLPGCDYVISLIEVAGLGNVRPDYEIPLKYGVDQCIGDTAGPGGVFKMLRTGPAWLEIVGDVERLCPGALVMNYTNPMSALTLLALRASDLAIVGLCHSVQGTSKQLAAYLDVPHEALRFRCGGINHMAWFVELSHRGQDLYPRLHEAARDPEIYDCDPVRFEVMRHFGAFVTESSGHFSEYVPYFRKRPDLIERYTREGYRGQSGFYADNWPRWRREADETVRAQLAGKSEINLKRGDEYASYIVEAVEFNRPALIHGNVANSGLIDNLPAGACVEVPVVVDGTGLHPTHFGPLPPQLAALNAAHTYSHELMVEAVLQRDRAAALQALMLDPLTAAVLAPTEIGQMFDEMWAAERADLGAFE
ncbi:MAG: alpha-galactosidase [Anaerolineae bacterium]|jgi:alpha-galactosidase